MERLHVARFESPIGEMRVAGSERGLAYLELPQASGRGLSGWVRRFVPEAELEEAYAPFRTPIAQLLEYLEGKRQVFDLRLDVRGTPFQRKVYEAVARIPYGHTRSYAEIAREVGQPSAVRAVGSANGANPIPLVIPCHRVIASDGKLGGYGGGLPLKAKLLAMESSRAGEDRLI
jgi:O-6-methylguanine DNA methyltransferase